MKNLFISFGVAFLVVLAYNLWDGDSPNMGDEKNSAEGFGSSITNSLSSILPGKSEDTAELKKHESGEHVVVIKSEQNHTKVEDAIERIENLKDKQENEGIDFARWTLFSENAKYSAAEKERILEKASELLTARMRTLLTAISF
jgi:hypothetical protein